MAFKQLGRENRVYFVDPLLETTVTVESDALAVATTAAWLDVTAWRDKFGSKRSRTADFNYASPQLWELRISCDAAETLTTPALWGVWVEPVTLADDTFTTTHAAETLTMTSHAFLDGDGPVQVSSSAGDLPAGFTADTDYWIIYVDANTVQLAASLADALAGTAVAISDDGTGTHTISDVQDRISEENTQRLHWALLGPVNDAANDGTGDTITVGAQAGYFERFGHSPNLLYYALVATSGTGAQTLRLSAIPVFDLAV